MKRVASYLALLLTLTAISLAAGAAGDAANATPAKLVAEAMAAVEHGAFNDAVDRMELLSDRGFAHPDASYARAFAYLERARSRSARPGDLGQSSAALEEYLRLRPGGDDDAEHALEAVRAEISRRQSRGGSSPVAQRPALGRALAELLPENVWAGFAALGSLLTTTGLVLYFWIKRRAAEIAGATAIVVGIVFGVLGGGLTFAARRYRLNSRPAVVVIPEARLLDQTGRPLPVRPQSPSAVPEGALVHVHEQREGKARVEWGTIDAWVEQTQLRFLVTEPSVPR
jgi:hypothetical protein